MMSQSSYSVTPDTRHNRFSSKINLTSLHACLIFIRIMNHSGRKSQHNQLFQVEQPVGEGSSTEVGPKKVEGGAAGGD